MISPHCDLQIPFPPLVRRVVPSTPHSLFLVTFITSTHTHTHTLPAMWNFNETQEQCYAFFTPFNYYQLNSRVQYKEHNKRQKSGNEYKFYTHSSAALCVCMCMSVKSVEKREKNSGDRGRRGKRRRYDTHSTRGALRVSECNPCDK